LDNLDRIILNTIQRNFPLDVRPYRRLATEAGISENEAWQRVQALKAKGIIRRIGGVFDSRSLGYVSTLCAAQVPAGKIPVLTALMEGITEITHNYLRDHHYNMWFTIIASSEERLQRILQQVREALGQDTVFSLPAQKVFKINVDFKFQEQEGNLSNNVTKVKDNFCCAHKNGEKKQDREQQDVPQATKAGRNYSAALTEDDKALVRLLQEDLPGSLKPFSDLAGELAVNDQDILEKIRRLLKENVMRRLGAILVHHKAGFTANAMGVWVAPEERVEEAGFQMAGFPEVSHCYLRPKLPDWPYNIFTMIHGQSRQECRDIMEKISRRTQLQDYALLFSESELKKSSMRYFLESETEELKII